MRDLTVQKIRVSSGDFLVVEEFGAEPGELLGEAQSKTAGRLSADIVRVVDRAELTSRQGSGSKQSCDDQGRQAEQSWVRLRHAIQTRQV